MPSRPVRVRRYLRHRPLPSADKRKISKLLDEMGKGFTEAYNLIPEEDFAERLKSDYDPETEDEPTLGQKIADDYHKPLEKLKRLLEVR